MKRSILLLALGVGAGYVLGARAGREPYDRLATGARRVWDDPRIAKARADVETYAKTQAPIVAERAQAFAASVPDRVTDGVQRAAEGAADIVGRTTVVAQDLKGRTEIVARKAATRAKGAARRATSAAQGEA
jgi:hypothetical protein